MQHARVVEQDAEYESFNSRACFIVKIAGTRWIYFNYNLPLRCYKGAAVLNVYGQHTHKCTFPSNSFRPDVASFALGQRTTPRDFEKKTSNLSIKM